MSGSKVAVSYVRFSSKAQAEGDSLRRQVEKTRAFCQRNGLILDETASVRDLAVSGFRGKNAKEGALADFLEQVREGRIARGTTLVIESLDRLGRDRYRTMSRLIGEILDAGISIATLTPERTYTPEEDNDMADVEIMFILKRAYEESQTKSERVGAANANKRKRLAAGEKFLLTRKCPKWLAPREDGKGFRIIPERKAIVQRIFDLALEGLGATRIATTLNAEGVPSFHGKPWATPGIVKLLKARTVLGELQMARCINGRKVPEGEPISGYYPAVIDEATFSKAQVAVRHRHRPKGRDEVHRTNIFKDLLFDAKTGEPMGINSVLRGRRSTGEARMRSQLATMKSQREGGGYKTTFLYDPLESAFVRFVADLDPADFTGRQGSEDSRLAGLASAITLQADRIRAVKQGIATAAPKDIPALLEVLSGLTEDRERLRGELAEAKAKQHNPTIPTLAETQTLLGLLAGSDEPEKLRVRIRARLRQLVESIWLFTYDVPGARNCICQVVFNDGTIRTFHTGYSLTRRPYAGHPAASEGVSERVDTVPFDLRTAREKGQIPEDFSPLSWYGPRQLAFVSINPPFPT